LLRCQGLAAELVFAHGCGSWLGVRAVTSAGPSGTQWDPVGKLYCTVGRLFSCSSYIETIPCALFCPHVIDETEHG
jgi:hypothetical protein